MTNWGFHAIVGDPVPDANSLIIRAWFFACDNLGNSTIQHTLKMGTELAAETIIGSYVIHSEDAALANVCHFPVS